MRMIFQFFAVFIALVAVTFSHMEELFYSNAIFLDLRASLSYTKLFNKRWRSTLSKIKKTKN